MAIARSSTLTVESTIEKKGGKIPSTMRAAVYRGVNDVRLEEVPVPEIGAGRNSGSRSHLRNLRHRSQEDCDRVALRAAYFWSRDLWRRRESRRRRQKFASASALSSFTTSPAESAITAVTKPSPSAPLIRKLAVRLDSSRLVEDLRNTSK